LHKKWINTSLGPIKHILHFTKRKTYFIGCQHFFKFFLNFLKKHDIGSKCLLACFAFVSGHFSDDGDFIAVVRDAILQWRFRRIFLMGRVFSKIHRLKYPIEVWENLYRCAKFGGYSNVFWVLSDA
jgi:hypothetical protein